METNNDILNQILRTVGSVQDSYKQLAEDVLSIKERIEVLSRPQTQHRALEGKDEDIGTAKIGSDTAKQDPMRALPPATPILSPSVPSHDGSPKLSSNDKTASPQRRTATSLSSRIILTTYPGQSGIDPIAMKWGHHDQLERGPVVVSRSQSTIRRRNGMRMVMPDFTNSEPAVNLGPFPQWADAKKIVSLDPLGHLSPWLFDSMIRNENIHIRPTIAITKAHMKLPELEQSVRAGRLKPDGKICLNETGELAVTKFAVEPVWFLPGIAERFGIDEGSLRRSLFENTGGSYPELITRGDLKLFLPPIGGLTVYCFGDPSKMSDPNVKLALRIHDECNGSDVFGSDICTCRPYLIFGVEEAVKEAQRGGSGVVVYFRKEGRALGEVTKYLVYNASK
ncbi:MAG: hypothetical protein Q9178_002220 [Gyalolechia marmorata]